jgi:glycosyltransferase involved in cell wall biosynthesis
VIVNKSRASSRRIFWISPVFPPTTDSEAFCGGKLALALLDAGLDLTVVYCTGMRYFAPDCSKMWEPLDPISTNLVIPPYSQRLKAAFGATLYRTHVYVRWVDAVVSLARRKHAERKFDLVYSRSLPAIAHVAGFWCAKKLNVPWVANLNDPWDKFLFPGGSKASALYTAVSMHWFKKTLLQADLVTCPSERLHQYHKRISKIDRPAVIVPHIGYPTPSSSVSAEPWRPAAFRLVHAGKLGSNEMTARSPNSLLVGLSDFLKAHPEARSETKLVLVGPEDTATTAVIAALGLQANVESVGSVSYEDSLRHIAGAAVCVLVEAKLEEGIFLPSKLVDYIAARKPVLALSPKVGVTADMAGQAGGGITHVSRHDAEAVQEAIAGLYADYRRGTLHLRAPSEGFAGQFKPDAVAGKFLAAIEPLGFSQEPERPKAKAASFSMR